MLKEKLLEDLKVAMREKQDLKKNVVQMIRAAVLQIEKDKKVELSDNEILEVIAKESKKRKDSVPEYEKSGRQDLLDKLNEEIEIISEYLPAELSEEEVTTIVKDIISEIGAKDIKDMGRVMKLAKEKCRTYSGWTINKRNC
jgi:uncharacterized protein YqeY